MSRVFKAWKKVFEIQGISMIFKELTNSDGYISRPSILWSRWCLITFTKRNRKELAPIISFIFSKSLETGEIPTDWLTANINAVLKKGQKQSSKDLHQNTSNSRLLVRDHSEKNVCLSLMVLPKLKYRYQSGQCN